MIKCTEKVTQCGLSVIADIRIVITDTIFMICLVLLNIPDFWTRHRPKALLIWNVPVDALHYDRGYIIIVWVGLDKEHLRFFARAID